MSNDTPEIGLKGTKIISDFVKTLPNGAGVYRMTNKDLDVLYVGKAKNLKKRVTAYTTLDKHPVRLQRMIAETTSMEFITTRTEAEALLLEAELIKKLKPRYNILLRDDKSFPYIWVTTDHDYPQVTKHRGSRKKKGDFYGPFATVSSVNRTLTLLQKAFMLRNCTDHMFETRSRPCLQYQIKRCTAPCVGYVTQDQYAKQVEQAQDFLTGKSRSIQKDLVKEMETASTAQDYETAALYRDRIKALTHVQGQKSSNTAELGNADVIAIYNNGGVSCVQVFFYRGGQSFGNRAYFPRHEKTEESSEILSAFIGQFYTNKPVPKDIYINQELPDHDLLIDALTRYAGYDIRLHVPKRGKKKLVIEHAVRNASEALDRKRASTIAQKELFEKLVDVFDLDETPKRIEVYDNSHIQGAHAIGAMIVATQDGFEKAHYRKFNIKDQSITNDDYGMMREVFARRFSRAIREDPDCAKNTWPDLIFIDGGQGQLSVVTETLTELGITDIPLIAIAKGEDRNAGRERFFTHDRVPFSLPMNDPVLYFVQRLRDESHRFAIGSHRVRRSKNTIKSELDDISGIGASRKKALLYHFGSLESIKQADIPELMNVEGISEHTAKNIYDRFHDSV